MRPGVKTPRRILVTDAQELAGLGAIRSLGRAGHILIAGYPSGQKPPPAKFSRYCAEQICHPDPWSQHFELRDWRLKAARSGRYEGLLPTTEATIPAAQAIRADLEQHLVLLLPKEENLKFTLSKYHATRMAQAIGLPVPATIFVRDPAIDHHVDADLRSLRYPIVIRTDNLLTPDGRYLKGQTVRVNSPQSAQSILSDLCSMSTGVLAQKLIKGRGIGAFILRAGGATRLHFAHKQIHEVPHTGGSSSFRSSSLDRAAIMFAGKLLRALDYEDVAMVEYVRHESGNSLYFLEINGRLWVFLSLSLHADVNFPLSMLESTLNDGGSIVQPDYREGVRCRTIPGELRYLESVLKADRRDLKSRFSKLFAVFEFIALSFNPAIHHDHTWACDPRPGLIAARQTAGRFQRRLQSKLRGAWPDRQNGKGDG